MVEFSDYIALGLFIAVKLPTLLEENEIVVVSGNDARHESHRIFRSSSKLWGSSDYRRDHGDHSCQACFFLLNR